MRSPRGRRGSNVVVVLLLALLALLLQVPLPPGGVAVAAAAAAARGSSRAPMPCWVSTPPSGKTRAARRARRRSRVVVEMMNESRSQQQPRKSEAYDSASRDRGAPAVILVRPYLDENIGSCARAMLNFGLTDLRIVKPFCSHLTDMARARASGADAILDNARVFDDLGEAVADLSEVVGTSARQRDMTIRIISPEQAAGLAAEALRAFEEQEREEGKGRGAKLGFLFGSERNGLSNTDLVYASALLQIPTQPAFSSLNLGMAVQLVGYEWYKARARMGDAAASALGYGYTAARVGVAKGTRLATVGEVAGLWGRCREMLDAVELNPDAYRAELIYARLENLLLRAESDVRDVNALHGALTALAVNHEKLEPLRQRLLQANAGHGLKRRGGKRTRAASASTATAAAAARAGQEDSEDEDDEGDEGDLALDEGVVRSRRRDGIDEAMEEERRERETGW